MLQIISFLKTGLKEEFNGKNILKREISLSSHVMMKLIAKIENRMIDHERYSYTSIKND